MTQFICLTFQRIYLDLIFIPLLVNMSLENLESNESFETVSFYFMMHAL